MIDKPLDAILPADLAALVSLGRAEGRTLDYKQALPDASDRGVRDFLADVTAFANTDGGDILVGVRDDGNGVAAEIVGIAADTLDVDLLRLENLIRDCVDPRLPRFRINAVGMPSGKTVLVLRVGASDIAPHRVTHRGSSRFHGRNSRGNFEMSTGELRRAFAATEEMPRRMRDLHRRAVEATGGQNMPCRLESGPVAVLTVAPASILREARDFRLSREEAVLPPLSEGSRPVMVVGLDGLVVHSPVAPESGCVRAWAMNQRRGYFDFAWNIGGTRDGRKLVWRKYFDGYLAGTVSASIGRLRQFNVDGPWVAMATLTGIRDHHLVTGDNLVTSAAWQEPAYLGEVVDVHLGPDALRPILDGFWRLFGVENGPGIGT